MSAVFALFIRGLLQVSTPVPETECVLVTNLLLMEPGCPVEEHRVCGHSWPGAEITFGGFGPVEAAAYRLSDDALLVALSDLQVGKDGIRNVAVAVVVDGEVFQVPCH